MKTEGEDEVMPFAATWMVVMLSEVGQTEKNKYSISYDTTCMWNLRKWYK